MKAFTVPNVNHAFVEALAYMKVAGVPETSRNGPVLVAPGPVCTEYVLPEQRLLFNPVRDANPVFHLMESIWMMTGSKDVSFLLPFNARFKEYAEPGTTLQHGAYGFRWKYAFGKHQLLDAIKLLKANPADRRVVVSMWDPVVDLGAAVRDVPCNTHMYLDCRADLLNMTVCCRSNDMFWGAYGANVVHFSVVQEIIAHAVGLPLGVYRQFSNNFHLYTDLPQVQELLQNPPDQCYDLYQIGVPATFLLTGDEKLEDFLYDCATMVNGTGDDSITKFFANVAWPLHDAYLARKRGEPGWREYLDRMPHCDWKIAFLQWADRRAK